MCIVSCDTTAVGTDVPFQLHPVQAQTIAAASCMGSHHTHTQDSARCRGKAPPLGTGAAACCSASCPHCQQVPRQDSIPPQSQSHSCTPGPSCGVPVLLALHGTVCIIQGGRIPPSFPLGLLQPLQIGCRKAGICRAPQVEGCGSQWLLLPSTSGSLPATSGAMAEQMSKAAACLSSCLLPRKVSSQARWSSSICSIFSF